MSRKEHSQQYAHRLRGVKVASGYFFPNGTDPVDNDTNVGVPFTATRTDVGEFSVTLDTGYYKLLFLDAVALEPAGIYKVDTGNFVDGADNTAAFVIQVYEQNAVSGVFEPADIALNDAKIAFRAEYLDLGSRQ